MIKVGSDFSGVGAFDQALKRLDISYETSFSCDMDKYARQTYIMNYGEPDYYPENVYDREIPKDPLDLYMTSPPCQSFSLAGKRKGESDKRGVLFYNSYEFIKTNKPRFFIFENVKGLLSDNGGKTFNGWINHLGGKSINGNPTVFPYHESVPYHLYYSVLNAKDYDIPQNRERVFIVGIRDESDNFFKWPKKLFLTKRLIDVLEEQVDEKYFLSDVMLSGFINRTSLFNRIFEVKDKNNVAYTVTTKPHGSVTDNYVLGYINQKIQGSTVYSIDGVSQTLCAGTHGYANGYIKFKSATEKGYELAEIGDSINLEQPNSKTRRGRVGKQCAQTLTTSCNQAVFEERIRRLTPRECFRLMDFPDSFKWNVSDTQAYKQAGNSICVGVLCSIISKLNLF